MSTAATAAAAVAIVKRRPRRRRRSRLSSAVFSGMPRTFALAARRRQSVRGAWAWPRGEADLTRRSVGGTDRYRQRYGADDAVGHDGRRLTPVPVVRAGDRTDEERQPEVEQAERDHGTRGRRARDAV